MRPRYCAAIDRLGLLVGDYGSDLSTSAGSTRPALREGSYDDAMQARNTTETPTPYPMTLNVSTLNMTRAKSREIMSASAMPADVPISASTADCLNTSATNE